jgi:predicted alpha/beta superfamily hydrolase
MLRAFRFGIVWFVVLLGARSGYGRNSKPVQRPATGAAPVAVSKLDQTTPVALPQSIQFDMTSKFSGRKYRVYVRRPPVPAPPDGYAVFLVMDGDGLFPLAAAGAGIHELRGDKPTLVVGVGYPSTKPNEWLMLRNRDLTPTAPPADAPNIPGQPPLNAENTGGAEALAAAYPINNQDQSLYGHSFGGLFALGVLLKHPEAFHSYLISSPSIWWNHKVVLQDEAAFSRRVEAGEISPRGLVLVGAGEQTPPDHLPAGQSREEMEKAIAQALMVDNARALGERLSKLHGASGYAVRWHVFEEEDHLTVLPASIGRSLTFALAP